MASIDYLGILDAIKQVIADNWAVADKSPSIFIEQDFDTIVAIEFPVVLLFIDRQEELEYAGTGGSKDVTIYIRCSCVDYSPNGALESSIRKFETVNELRRIMWLNKKPGGKLTDMSIESIEFAEPEAKEGYYSAGALILKGFIVA